MIQKELGKEITVRVHSKEEYDALGLDRNIMFDRSIGKEELASMGREEFEKSVGSFDKVEVNWNPDLGLLPFLSGETGIYASNGEARRALQGNAVAINKEKIKEDFQIQEEDWLYGFYMIVSKGKKKHVIVKRGE